MTKVEPPTINEVVQIVDRRRRARNKAAQALGASAFVGGLAAIGFMASGGASQEASVPPASSGITPPTGLPEVTTPPEGVIPGDFPECVGEELVLSAEQPVLSSDIRCGWKENFFDGFSHASALGEAQELADEWVIPLEEVKMLAGLVVEQGPGEPLTTISQLRGVSVEASNAWAKQSVNPAELDQIAEEWELDPFSIKIIDWIAPDLIS